MNQAYLTIIIADLAVDVKLNPGALARQLGSLPQGFVPVFHEFTIVNSDGLLGSSVVIGEPESYSSSNRARSPARRATPPGPRGGSVPWLLWHRRPFSEAAVYYWLLIPKPPVISS
jgi:hypothetical protein